MIIRLLLIQLIMWQTLSASAATPWFVDSEFQRVSIEQYLKRLWPEHPFTVVLGPHTSTGIWYRNGTLTFAWDGETVQEPMIWDVFQMISMAREWHNQVMVEDTGWAPEVQQRPSIPAPAAPTAQAPPFPTPIQFQIGISGYVNEPDTPSTFSTHVTLIFPFTTNTFRAGPLIGLDLFRRKAIDLDGMGMAMTNISMHHVDMGVHGAWAPREFLELTVLAACRLHIANAQTTYSPTGSPLVPVGTMGVGVRSWIWGTKSLKLGLYSTLSADIRTGGIWVGGVQHSPYQVRAGILTQLGKK